jgi:hypothetical protein
MQYPGFSVVRFQEYPESLLLSRIKDIHNLYCCQGERISWVRGAVRCKNICCGGFPVVRVQLYPGLYLCHGGRSTKVSAVGRMQAFLLSTEVIVQEL